MKPFTAIICLFAIACNAALAGVGSMAFCVGKGPELRFSVECADEQPDPCCPSEAAEAADALHPLTACDTCLDGKINASDQDESTRNGDRSTLKPPLPLYTLPVDLLLPFRSKSLCSLEQRPSRSPPVAAQAVQQFAKTVALRL